MTLSRLVKYAQRKSTYLLQKLTGLGVDDSVVRELSEQASAFLSGEPAGTRLSLTVPRLNIVDLDLEDTTRYTLVRDDIYRRFVWDKAGSETDKFGRRGHWVPRGSKIYFDTETRDYVKVFDEYFCSQGEGAFLESAINAGVYDFLCPNLSYLIQNENDHILGYAILEGKPLSPYEFERYVGGILRDVICEVTRRSGFYFYDLEFHNVVRSGSQLSLIDLESVLPIKWFGKGIAYARDHLDVIDIGWPLNEKWRSPRWYRDFLVDLIGPDGIQPPRRQSKFLPDFQ